MKKCDGVIEEQAENKDKDWDMTGPTGTSASDLFRASTQFRSGGRDLRAHRVCHCHANISHRLLRCSTNERMTCYNIIGNGRSL
jgi:hypothetical protein